MIRASAMRMSIGTVLSAPMGKEGETNGLRIGSDIVNRVNIIGLVVGFQPEERMLSLDDGTGTIAVQWFEGQKPVSIGDVILLIGRVRDFDERYVFPEIIKPLDKAWLDVRKKELERMPPIDFASAQTTTSEETSGQDASDDDFADDPEESALKLIHDLDRGEGADMDEVYELLGAQGEEIVKRLLMAGEIFESKPGRLRLL